MTKTAAISKALSQSRGNCTVFLCEYIDQPGRFDAVPELEYYRDPASGWFYDNAEAVFFNGERVD